MNKYFFTIAILALNSCNVDLSKSKVESFLKDLKIISIELKLDGETRQITDTLATKRITISLTNLKSNDLIKGRRLHGATLLCDLTLKSNKNDLLIFVVKNKEDEIMLEFFEQDEEDNFKYYLGRLYESEKMLKTFKELGIECVT